MKNILLSFTLLLLPIIARATLGESDSTIELDSKALQSTSKIKKSNSSFTVYEMDSAGTLIREYVSSNGVVFAICWNGITHPDLNKLLGSYYSEYKNKVKQSSKRNGKKHRAVVKTANIVLETWGHMRNLSGRSYVPSLLPIGVNVDDIQ